MHRSKKDRRVLPGMIQLQQGFATGEMGLRGSNPDPLMSALGQAATAAHQHPGGMS
jgi:hypothetical protein